ncbi:signal recognition particle protein [Candidatus Pacearchaeota archaeon]|nr:signal recognition particle protein [Candidatus Pacearchaeota archaeon]
MLEKLGNAIKSGIDKIAGAIFVDKRTIDSALKDIQRALLEADVNVKLVKEISDKLRHVASDEKIKGIDRKEHVIKILYDELERILGKSHAINFEKNKCQKIMLVGLYGSGKTTTIAKLANYYAKRGFKTAMLGLDVHRPAATDQLEQLAKKNALNYFIDRQEKNPVKIWKKYKKELEKYELVFIDTAGRDALDSELIAEIHELNNVIAPDYSILIMPADIGQAAKKQAEEFNKIGIQGVIITRMDSSAKGGGALTACAETNALVFFITTGEKINDIETFAPKTFVSRLMGLGDLEGLLERVQSVIDEKQEKRLKKSLEEGKLTLLDIYEQLKAMEGMGSMKKILSMVPGFGQAKIPEELLGKQEGKMKKWKHAIDSMTHEEIENPELLEKQPKRIQRISKGSGVSASDIRSLLKQWKIINDFAKGGINPEAGLSEKQMQKLAKKFGKRMKF